MANIRKMSKMRQIDFMLLRKIESVEVKPNPPVSDPQMRGDWGGQMNALRDYWFERGRKEALMEIRVMLRTEMGL